MKMTNLIPAVFDIGPHLTDVLEAFASVVCFAIFWYFVTKD